MDHGTALPPAVDPYAPSLTTSLDRWTPHVLSILRIVVALLFLQHGLSKLFGFPQPMPPPPLWTMEWFSGVIEFGWRRAADARPVHAGRRRSSCRAKWRSAISCSTRHAAFFPARQWRQPGDPVLLRLSVFGFRRARAVEPATRCGSAAPAPLRTLTARSSRYFMRAAAPASDRPSAYGRRGRRSPRSLHCRRRRNPHGPDR